MVIIRRRPTSPAAPFLIFREKERESALVRLILHRCILTPQAEQEAYIIFIGLMLPTPMHGLAEVTEEATEATATQKSQAMALKLVLVVIVAVATALAETPIITAAAEQADRSTIDTKQE